MFQVSGTLDVSVCKGDSRIVSLLLWLSLTTGFAVSVFTVVEELCLATACKDTASFAFFGVGMGWFGIAYFSLILTLLWLRKKFHQLDLVLAAMVYSGIGAEVRLLWIQKFVIGSWCPLCVTIFFALLLAAALLLIEKVQYVGSGRGRRGKSLLGWLTFVMAMTAIGLAIAVAGVKSLAY